MNRDSGSRWAWLVLAAAFVCISAQAQTCYTLTCYSSLDIDSYGNMTGASATEEPYYYYEIGGVQAYAEGQLFEGDPSAELLDDVIAYDDGGGYAEADTSGTATSGYSYYEAGYHYLYDLEDDYYYLGYTEADVTAGPTCAFPYYDNTTLLGQDVAVPTLVAFDPYPFYTGEFDGRLVTEAVGDGSTNSSCADPSLYPGGIPFTIGGEWTVGSSFWGPDENGYTPTGVANFRTNGWVPCGAHIYQDVYMNCNTDTDWSYYTTHDILVSVGTTTLTVLRDGMYGYTNFPYP